MSEIIIRPAKAEEFDVILPALAARAYQDRFFDEDSITKSGKMLLEREKLLKKEDIPSFPFINQEDVSFLPFENQEEFLEYSGSLSVPFSVLRPQSSGVGQSFQSFQEYWEKKKEDSKFRAFVAEVDGRVIGFVKGTFDYVDCAEDFPQIEELQGQRKVCSLGSLYVDSEFRRTQGVGTRLVQEWSRRLLKEKPDCQGMLTDCYWRNNSQYFFNKLGAESIGFCSIPDTYLAEEQDENGRIALERRVQDISGEVMLWTRERLENLIGTDSLGKGQMLAVVVYTRNTSQYSLMTAAEGSMVEFVKLRKENSGIAL